MKIFLVMGMLFIALILFACMSQNINTKSNDKTPSYFIIGSGGGFTGAYTKYKVFSNGKVDKFDYNSETYSSYTEIKKELTDGYFDELTKLNIENRDIDYPGNMTFFIEVLHDDHLHSIKWGDANHKVGDEIENYFNKVMTEILRIEREN